MPSVSKKQRRFMAAAAKNPKFARRAGIDQNVAKEYHSADKRAKRFQTGGLAQALRPQMPHSRTMGPTRGGGIPGRVPNGLMNTVGRRMKGSENTLVRPGGALGQFAKGGKVREMTKWIKEHGGEKSEYEALKRKLREMGSRDPEGQIRELLKTRRKSR